MNDSILKNIRAEYDQKQFKAMNELDKRRDKLYNHFPEIRQIDEDIAMLSIKLSKIILTKPDNIEEQVMKLKENIEELKKERNDIYTKNKISKNYLKPKYVCSLCKDTGYLEDGKRCKCYKQRIIEVLYNMSNIKEMIKKENFNVFNINVFSNNKYKDEEVTPRQNMYTILATCEDFCENFDKTLNSMLFYGGTGLGKTFMCNCIANELLNRGKTVIYQTSSNLIEIVENHKFNKIEETAFNRENYKFLFECDLLIIDDLGTELVNSFTNSELFNIINSRMTMGKKMIISTNLTLDQLAATYSDRIVSRIFNEFAICYFYGKDLRWEV